MHQKQPPANTAICSLRIFELASEFVLKLTNNQPNIFY